MRYAINDRSMRGKNWHASSCGCGTRWQPVHSFSICCTARGQLKCFSQARSTEQHQGNSKAMAAVVVARNRGLLNLAQATTHTRHPARAHQAPMQGMNAHSCARLPARGQACTCSANLVPVRAACWQCLEPTPSVPGSMQMMLSVEAQHKRSHTQSHGCCCCCMHGHTHARGVWMQEHVHEGRQLTAPPPPALRSTQTYGRTKRKFASNPCATRRQQQRCGLH